MMQRCHDKNASNYKHYGARGIRVCQRWHSFSAFLTDMGKCPGKSMTLDRLDNELPYQPNNCRWTTQAEQNRNRSNCVQITFGGVTRNVTDWAAAAGMTANALHMRLRLGWTVERALTQPLKARTV